MKSQDSMALCPLFLALCQLLLDCISIEKTGYPKYLSRLFRRWRNGRRVVHESLNLSSILPAPVLFVVENNLFSSHMHISLRQPNISVSRFAYANNIPYKLVDGNNISQLIDSSKELIEMSRENGTLPLLKQLLLGITDM